MDLLVETAIRQAQAAGIQEIFSSIQGEGPYVGCRQVFVRFQACHLKCAYCDTPTDNLKAPCLIEDKPGSHTFRSLENPLSLTSTWEEIGKLLSTTPHHSVSFTGGEPLLYTPFLENLLPMVQAQVPVYLETSGTQPEKLQSVLPWVDIIAMDIKLPSTTGQPLLLDAHRSFYELGRSKDLFIKLVVSTQTPLSELDAVFDIVTQRNTPIILQPMTSLDTGRVSIDQTHLFAMQAKLAQTFLDVRVIPQSHKMLSIL